MARGRLRLHHRIVVPFALVALATTSATAFVAVSVTSQALESRVKTQVLNTATLVAQSDFALNPVILRSVKAITGADVITFDANALVVASTIEPGAGNRLVRAVTAPDATRAALPATPGAVPTVRQMDCGIPCYVAYRRVGTRPDAIVAVIADTSELSAATRRLAITVAVGAALSLAAMIVVSQFVARRVTAPINDLVAFTREVSPDGSPLRAHTGPDEVGRLGAAFNDMLDRLDRSRHALVRSEKLGLAGLMAARVAHDVRNPLSSIKMHTQLVRARLRDDAETEAIVGAMLRDIQQVEAVVRDLIELARPGELKRRPMPLNDLVGDVLSQLSLQLTHRKVSVDLALADKLPLVNLDPERFRQALVNVVGNAADAMATGGTLRVITEAIDGGTRVVLDVCDTGTGIDPEIRQRIFDPFVSTKRDGVGLGLVNAKAVVESHDGTIELTAIEPKGTRARITLPAGILHG
jgi:signal transduction histidine kinase